MELLNSMSTILKYQFIEIQNGQKDFLIIIIKFLM